MDQQNIINHIQQLSNSQYVKINIRQSIVDFFDNITPQCSETDKLHIQQFLNIINHKIASKDMITLNGLKKIVVGIINKIVVDVEQVKDDSKKNTNMKTLLTTNNKSDVCDVIDNKTVEEIEELLDGGISCYNKFNNDNPMMGVHFSQYHKRYNIEINKFKTSSVKLDDACMKVVKKMKTDNAIIGGENQVKFWFKYKNKILFVYQIKNDLCFDIQHVLKLLNLHKSAFNNKYNKFSSDIEHQLWQKNKFNGYILRELISEATMYELIMSSTSDFSKHFKKDVSNILVQLRSNNLLTIQNNTLQLNNNITSSKIDTTNEQCHKTQVGVSKQNGLQAQDTLQKDNIIDNNSVSVLKNESNMNNDHYMIFKQAASHKLFSYDSIQDISFVKHLVRNGSDIILTKYINKNVMYLVLLPIKTSTNLMIIKFGFTDNITNRLKTLKDEYKCNIFLLELRLVNTRSQEEQFHILLHKKYPDCVFDYATGGKNKNELYFLAHNLVMEFSHISVDLNQLNDNNIYVDSFDEVAVFLKKQYAVFSNFIEENIYIDNKLKYNYLITVDNNAHEKYMAKLKYDNIDKEIYVAKLKYDNIDKEMMLLEKQIRLAELRH